MASIGDGGGGGGGGGGRPAGLQPLGEPLAAVVTSEEVSQQAASRKNAAGCPRTTAAFLLSKNACSLLLSALGRRHAAAHGYFRLPVQIEKMFRYHSSRVIPLTTILSGNITRF